MKGPKPRAGSRRERPTPKWLKTADLNDMARRRCLMILSVLSGAVSVSTAIEEAKISRGTYYQLETRAVKAMLEALVLGAELSGEGEGLTLRLVSMEKKLAHAEKDRRRAERLLYLTKQLVRPGPVTTGKGPRAGRKRRTLTKAGSKPSMSWRKTRTETKGTGPSTPQAAGTAGP